MIPSPREFPIAWFAYILARLKRQLAAGVVETEVDDDVMRLYALAARIRDMSRSEEWKEPCNRVRAALGAFRVGSVVLAEYIAACDALLAHLCREPLQPHLRLVKR